MRGADALDRSARLRAELAGLRQCLEELERRLGLPSGPRGQPLASDGPAQLPAELGLRPISHRTARWADSPPFLTVLADQLGQVLRTCLRAPGEPASWATPRGLLAGPQRVHATCRRPAGRTLHVRTATQAAPAQRALSAALGIDSQPGGVRQTII